MRFAFLVCILLVGCGRPISNREIADEKDFCVSRGLKPVLYLDFGNQPAKVVCFMDDKK